MHIPAAVLTLTASTCLVFASHCARLSGTSVVWLSSFVALLTFLARFPRALRSKAAVCDTPRHKSRLLSAGACALFCLSATYGLATLGALRFACACACAAGADHIARTRRSSRNAKMACTALSCVILALTSDPGQETRPFILFGALGVLCAACAISLSTKDVVKKADQTAFLFAACGLSLVGFIATLVQHKPIVENEMLLLLVFCVSGIVLAGCVNAGLVLQGNAFTFVAAAAGMSAGSVVCGEKVFPAVYDWESLALLTSAGLIFAAHKGLTFADSSVASLSGVSLNPTQMLKTKQHREESGIIVSLLSNSRERKLFVFLLLTVGIMLLELIYGLAVNSLGLISDSFHMMLDGASIIIGLYAAHAASWLPDEKTHPFGYGRYEVFGGFVNGILLLFIALYVMVESIQRFLNPPEIEGPYLLLVSVIGLAVNVVGIIFFHDSHGHSHSHSHGEAGSGHVDHNMRGVYLHILADLLGSVSVIISSILIYLFGLWIADPICSAMSAILVLLSAFPLLEETGKVLLLSAPNHESNYCDKLREALLATSLLQDVESPKLWIHSTPPRELTICTVAGKLRNSTEYTSARKKITETVTAHMMHHLDVHNVSFVLHLE
ncbi:cation transporter, putative [Leishmania donovani]|uniref:Cation transporter, putative n=1 Tax=Leishmania donovani TaxID=5661 RepID=E9BJ48_LEIDO|nr:cation transporter, putative [Leishmania donovani]CBZ35274.1 cation transporter, putative [Leishmania donovani]